MTPEEHEKKQTDYFASGANVCPHCSSHEITGGQFDADGLQAWRKVSCDDCGKTWTELFDMVGFQ